MRKRTSKAASPASWSPEASPAARVETMRAWATRLYDLAGGVERMSKAFPRSTNQHHELTGISRRCRDAAAELAGLGLELELELRNKPTPKARRR